MTTRPKLVVIVALVLAACSEGAQGRATATMPPPTETRKEVQPEVRPKWGAPIPSPELEAKIAAVIRAVGEGKAAERVRIIAVGPALWKVFSQEPKLRDLGVPMIGVIPVGKQSFTTEGRGIRFEGVAPFLEHELVRRTFARFADGTVAPANDAGRHAFYTLIPYEIDGQPLTVMHRDDDVMLVQVLADKDGK